MGFVILNLFQDPLSGTCLVSEKNVALSSALFGVDLALQFDAGANNGSQNKFGMTRKDVWHV
jgi:hypothetical protein